MLLTIAFIVVSVIILYFTSNLQIWSAIGFIFLLLTHLLVKSSTYHIHVWYLLCFIYLLIVIIFNLPWFRRFLISNWLFGIMKKALPKISVTEELALKAGGNWYEKEIFCGTPNFKLLHASKKFSLNAEEQSFLDNETTTLCAMVNDWQINHKDHDLPIEAWNYMREKGFFGLVIAKEYGGKGFSASAHSQIVMKLATRSTTLAVTVMVPNSLGPGELLQHYGSEEQKQHFLPRLASGEEIPCFALTSPVAGSDATSIIDEGIVCEARIKEEIVLGIRLRNVEKRYITLAPVATLVGLAFKLKDPEGLLDGVGSPGITCALLPYNHEGVEIGNRLLPLNLSFMNGTIRIKDTFIPIDWIIGGQKMAGNGWKMLVECLSIGRSISLPACGVANGLLSLVTTSAYASVREQFKTAIGNFEGVEDVLAKMGSMAYLMNATREFTVSAVDSEVRPSVASAIAKYHLTEMGRILINHAMDIHGGRAIIMGPNNYLGNIYQGVPVGITVEGANIMSRNLLIFGQGIMKCHPYLFDEYKSLSTNDMALFDRAVFGHLGYLIRNKVRALTLSFTAGKITFGHKSEFRHYYQQITRLSSAYSYLSDVVLFLLGGNIKSHERTSARLGDIMSYLYMACATLKYYRDHNEEADDKVFVLLAINYCLFNAQEAFYAIFANFPVKALGRVIQFFLFPYGRIFNESHDYLEHKLAQGLLHNCATRERFKKLCFVVEDDFNDPVGRMEFAFLKNIKVIPIKDKIHKAHHEGKIVASTMAKMAILANNMEIISDDELALLQESIEYNSKVIQVDEFKSAEIGAKNAHPSWSQN